MKTKHITGNTTFNDTLNLPAGMLSIDSEKQALRFYDGQTVGGYEMAGTRAVPPNVGPGPEVFIAGDMNTGFFGEVTSSELMTYESLATQVGLSAGISQFNEESLWLKFALDGQILYIAKKPARHTVSWTDIQQANILYGETTTQVEAHTLKVRLIKGANTDPAEGERSSYDPPESSTSEWNRLMYNIHVDGPGTEGWASYNDADLVVGPTGSGRLTWCQEAYAPSPGYYLFRGGETISFYTAWLANANVTNTRGWRPVLELIP